MKQLFKGYFRKSDSEIKDIWDNGIITFDANVLLNLYRYSKDTQKELLEIFEKFKDKIWLTHQAALEYNRNRYEVIAEQQKAYDDFNKSIEKIEGELRNTSRSPFLSKNLHENLEKVFNKVKTEIKESADSFESMLKEDQIYEKVNTLFDEKVGLEFSQVKLNEIYSLGKERFDKKIPPGFEDEKNKEDNREFGDLILWEQIKNKAKEDKKHIILITDERKKDWWWKLNDGRTIGPRQELVKELWDFAQVEFLMYSSDRFLTFASNYLPDQEVSKQALDEIRERKKYKHKVPLVEELSNSIKENEKRKMLKMINLKNVNDLQPDEILERLEYLNSRIRNAESRIHELSSEDMSLSDKLQVELLRHAQERYSNEYFELSQKSFEFFDNLFTQVKDKTVEKLLPNDKKDSTDK